MCLQDLLTPRAVPLVPLSPSPPPHSIPQRPGVATWARRLACSPKRPTHSSSDTTCTSGPQVMDPVSRETIPEPSPSRYRHGITAFSVPMRPTSGWKKLESGSPDIKLEFALLSHDRQSPSATEELRSGGRFLNLPAPGFPPP